MHYQKLEAMLRLEWGDAAADRLEADDGASLAGMVFALLTRYKALQGGGVHGGAFQA
eukprot:COSAG01_NODE_59241_length_301_cov_1.004950_1_plen_56_part_01